MTAKKKIVKPTTPKRPVRPANKAPSNETLVNSIGETLLKNLSTTPPNLWATPVKEALQSAFQLGQRNAGKISPAKVEQQGEDRVLEKGEDNGVDDMAHEIVMALGRQMALAGVRPEHIKLRCNAVTTQGNEQYFTLTTTIPPNVAARMAR